MGVPLPTAIRHVPSGLCRNHHLSVLWGYPSSPVLFWWSILSRPTQRPADVSGMLLVLYRVRYEVLPNLWRCVVALRPAGIMAPGVPMWVRRQRGIAKLFQGAKDERVGNCKLGCGGGGGAYSSKGRFLKWLEMTGFYESFVVWNGYFRKQNQRSSGKRKT